MSEANIMTTGSAARALSEEFGGLPRGADGTYVLVYQEDLRNPNGEMPKGFVPGHVATVFPAGYASTDWAVGRLPDGKTFSLVPRSDAEVRDKFTVDVLDKTFGTYSLTRS